MSTWNMTQLSLPYFYLVTLILSLIAWTANFITTVTAIMNNVTFVVWLITSVSFITGKLVGTTATINFTVIFSFVTSITAILPAIADATDGDTIPPTTLESRLWKMKITLFFVFFETNFLGPCHFCRDNLIRRFDQDNQTPHRKGSRS